CVKNANGQQANETNRFFQIAFLALTIVSFVGGCASKQIKSVSLENEMFTSSAIDMHYHASMPFTPEEMPIPFPEIQNLLNCAPQDAARIIAKNMNDGGIGLILLMGQTGIPGDPLGINRNLEIASYLPSDRIKLIAAVDPRKTKLEGHLEAARKQLETHKDKIVAFKCYTCFHGNPLDPGYLPYYDLAMEYNLPVIFHSGTAHGKFYVKDCTAHTIDQVAVNYPELKIVIAHSSNPLYKEAAQVASKNNNVWLDVSALVEVGYDLPGWQTQEQFDAMMARDALPDALPYFIINDYLEALAYLNKYDRILFGSDFAICSPRNARRFWERVIPKEHHAKVFRENAEKVFGVDIPDTYAELDSF
ncbi:amidohydrolase family protein, partial [Planctomycetota bacterium]